MDTEQTAVQDELQPCRSTPAAIAAREHSLDATRPGATRVQCVRVNPMTPGVQLVRSLTLLVSSTLGASSPCSDSRNDSAAVRHCRYYYRDGSRHPQRWRPVGILPCAVMHEANFMATTLAGASRVAPPASAIASCTASSCQR